MIQEFKFKDFLLNEQQNILSEKIGNVLSALQTLSDSISNLGIKQKNELSDRIVADIRTIIKGQWPKENIKYLTTLQKIAVQIKNIIYEKGDFEDELPKFIDELEGLLEKMGTPINNLVPTEKSPAKPDQITPPVEKNANLEEPPKVAPDQAPKQPEDLETLDQGKSPNSSPGLNFEAQPLGGSSGPLLGI